MMQVTEYFKKCVLRVLEGIPEDAVSGTPVPEMDGYFVIHKGRAPEQAVIVATIRPDDNEQEYEVYVLSNGSAK